jgi:hypothetical protein
MEEICGLMYNRERCGDADRKEESIFSSPAAERRVDILFSQARLLRRKPSKGSLQFASRLF